MNVMKIALITTMVLASVLAGSPAYASVDAFAHDDSIWAAYVDPTAGGVLIQILLVGAAGILGLVKLFWKRIFPGRRTGQNNDPADPQKGSH